MIDFVTAQDMTGRQAAQSAQPRKVLRMVENDRMAGSVPAWVDAEDAGDEIASRLSAIEPGAGQKAGENFADVMALHDAGAGNNAAGDDESFGFGDLIDMVNPLQHIPLVGTLYRELTGDEIRPIGRIIGGGVFGGPLGAAGGLINVIAEEETGDDLAGNALNIVMGGDAPELKTPDYDVAKANDPAPLDSTAEIEQRLARVLNKQDELPGSVLAFADLRHAEPAAPKSSRPALRIEDMPNFRTL